MVVLFSCQKGKYTYDASGIFEATEIIVSAEATGKIMRFEINEGAELNTEQQSGYIDTIQLHWLKMQLLSNITAVNSRKQDIPKQIAAAQQQITTLKKELQRTDKLISANAANRKQRDDTEAQIALLEKQLTAQLSLLESNNQAVSGECAALFNQIAQIDDQIVKSRIVSPINGTVLAKYAEQGELTSVGKPLFKMADMKNMYLRAYVTSGQLTELKLGQPVSVYADYKDKETRKYKGTLAWISDKAEFTPKTIQTRDERANLVYAVKIAVENDGLLKIGMYADVKFTEQ
jgi:HlyD family secretion protein